MKLLISLLFLSLFLTAFKPGEQYMLEMKESISIINDTDKAGDLENVKERLEAIHQSEPDQWLPIYYLAMVNLKLSKAQSGETDPEQYYDRARTLLSNALDQWPSESELMVLLAKVYIDQCEEKNLEESKRNMMVAQGLLNEAIQFEERNPRAYFLMGKSIYEINKKAGDDTGESCEYFNEAVDRFNSFKVSGELYPNWGFDQNMRSLASCKSAEDSNSEEERK